MTVADDNEAASTTLSHAREYLELHDVQATSVRKESAVAGEILAVAEEYETGLLVMCGYGFSPSGVRWIRCCVNGASQF